MLRKTALAVAAMLALPATALAHHSFAMFDMTKTTRHTGKVKEVQWTNPHSYIQLIVEEEGKPPVEWSVEIGSPAINTALGWKKTSVKRGDKVTMLLSPARNGKPYGTLRKLTFEDGRELIGVAGSMRSPPPALAPATPAQGK